MIYTIIIIAENRPGVLYRLANLLTKRKINIENLSAHETHTPGISQIILIAHIKPEIIDTLIKQMDKIIEVINIKYY